MADALGKPSKGGNPNIISIAKPPFENCSAPASERSLSTPRASRSSGQGDFVKVDCGACQHVALLMPEGMLRLGRRSELDHPEFGPIWRERSDCP